MARYRSARTGVEMTIGDNPRVGLGSEWELVQEPRPAAKQPVKRAATKKPTPKKSDD